MKFLISPILAVAIILLFPACSAESERDAKKLKENTEEALKEGAEGAKEDFSAAGETIKEELEVAGEVVKDVAESAAEGVVETAKDVKAVGVAIGKGAKDAADVAKERFSSDSTPVPTATPAP